MKKNKSNFERNWLIIFLSLYGLIMIPFPFFYSTEYIPGPWGVPLFLFGWLIFNTFVLIMIGVFARQCLKRPEYQNFEEEQNQADQTGGEA